MNYALHYTRLIDRARCRVLAGYVEKHHVVPRCLGGTDDDTNIVNLTAEEHYVAHQLLVKIHPNVCGLAYAAVVMAKRCSSNKAYGWLRRMVSESRKNKRRGSLSPEWRAKIGMALVGNTHLRGKILSAETRAKMSQAHKGNKATLGHKLSDEHKRKIGLHSRGNKYNLGKKASDETKQKMSLARVAYYQRLREARV